MITAALAVAGCTPVPPGPPVINAFSVNQSSGSSPLTAAFTWDISGSPLTCGLDLDDDGDFEVSIPSCTSDSIRSATFDSPGEYLVRLQATDGTVTATSNPIPVSVSPAETDSFAIAVRFNGTPTAPQQAAFDSAASRWAEVIRTGLSDIPIDIAADDCGTGAPAFSGTIDDLLIDAEIGEIDGAGGVLGQAGPCLVRTTGGLPVYGVMKFDSADIAALEASGRLEDVILHEMGHVLGVGTVWESNLVGAGTPFPRFTGLTARGAWDAVAGGSGLWVPVENNGGPGTADSHWSEATFTNELMTGFIGSGTNPLSAITIGSLADIGYGVDLGAADPFGSPALTGPTSPTTQLHTELIHPMGEVPG